MINIKNLQELRDRFIPKKTISFITNNGSTITIRYNKRNYGKYYYYVIIAVPNKVKTTHNYKTKLECIEQLSKKSDNLFKDNIVKAIMSTPELNMDNDDNLKRECRSILNEVELFLEELDNDPKEMKRFQAIKESLEKSKFNK